MSNNRNKTNTNLNSIKMQAANEVGVPLKQGYNGDLTARQVGSVGGQMVKKMIESYENSQAPNNQMPNNQAPNNQMSNNQAPNNQQSGS